MNLSAEEEQALQTFREMLSVCPDQAVRGVRRYLIEGWIDGQATWDGAVYPDILGAFIREIKMAVRDAVKELVRLSPTVLEYSKALVPGQTPDNNSRMLDLLAMATEYCFENDIEI